MPKKNNRKSWADFVKSQPALCDQPLPEDTETTQVYNETIRKHKSSTVKTENALQDACIKWFEEQYGSHAKIMHISNQKTARAGAQARDAGYERGFPDLMILYPSGGYHSLFIELKKKLKKDGTMYATENNKIQEEYHKYLRDKGFLVCLCDDYERFKDIVINYMNG